MLYPTTRTTVPLATLVERTVALVLFLGTVLLASVTIPSTLEALRNALFVIHVGAACLGQPSWVC